MCLFFFSKFGTPKMSRTFLRWSYFLHVQILHSETCGSWICPFAWNCIEQLECLWSLILGLCMSMGLFCSDCVCFLKIGWLTEGTFLCKKKVFVRRASISRGGLFFKQKPLMKSMQSSFQKLSMSGDLMGKGPATFGPWSPWQSGKQWWSKM